ncbi:hypothetical protein D3C71_308910 [compost metagenome]
MQPDPARDGYLTIDAMVALSITTIAVTAAVVLASTTVARISQARDKLIAARIAEDIYEDLYAGERPDGVQHGETQGRTWSYATTTAGSADTPSSARRARIVVDRRMRDDLVVDAVLPAAPATASSNS